MADIRLSNGQQIRGATQTTVSNKFADIRILPGPCPYLLFECENGFPIILHVDDGPALGLGFTERTVQPAH